MEIRDPIHGSIEVTPAEVAVIDSPAYQRLRSIKQLGFSEFSFPGATHNRFIHSLGVCHLAGQAFDSIFKGYRFAKPENRWRLRQATRLAALLHDIGHGPLSHSTEEVMPLVKDLSIKAYENCSSDILKANETRQANHEDYTVKFITDSHLTEVLNSQFKDIEPFHIACLIDKTLPNADDFFKDQGLCLRNILSQIVSSEMDVDRMDYLARDGYFCGTNYGAVESSWLLQNLTFHVQDEKMNLALNRRALYTFDDFLISRHHMHLIVYFHHKSIIFEEMLYRYLRSEDCCFELPADIEEYLKYTDFFLYEHMASVENRWAKRIASRQPFRVVFEQHVTEDSNRMQEMSQFLDSKEIESIPTSSKARLSKYHGSNPADQMFKIFVVDEYDKKSKPVSIDECTEIFKRYEDTRIVERLYVPPESHSQAVRLIQDNEL